MQMKLLYVALATALTATLTGCGGDGDTKYSKQTVQPINVGSGASSTELERLQKELADAKAKGTATEEKLKALEAQIAKLSGNNDNDKGDKDKDKTKPGKGEGNDKPKDEKPEGGETDAPTLGEPVTNKDKKNNIGDAANTNKTVEENNIVGFQSYDRGVATQFDRSLNENAADTGTTTIVNHNELENRALSNIVLARPSVNRVQKTVYAGENPNDVNDFTFATQGQLDLQNDSSREALQRRNLSRVEYNSSDSTWAIKQDADNNTSGTQFQKGERHNDGDLSQFFALSSTASNSDTGSRVTDGATLATVNETQAALIGSDILANEDVTDINGTTVSVPRPTAAYLLSRDYVSPNNSNPNDEKYTFNQLVELNSQLRRGNSRNPDFKNGTNLPIQERSRRALQRLSEDAYESGLVRMYSQLDGKQSDNEYLGTDASNKKRFVVRGQERPVTQVKDGKLKVIHRTGFEEARFVNGLRNEVRMFGSLYRDANGTVGDIPEQVWSNAEGKFVDNTNEDGSVNYFKESEKIFKLSGGTPNSYQHTSAAANEEIAKLEELDLKYFRGGDDAAAKQSRKYGQYRAAFTAKPIHLNHVQYGRVTVNADDANLSRIQNDFVVNGQERSNFTLAHKFTKKHDEKVTNINKKDTNVDFYFARGLQDTKEMPKEGKVTYLGHALAYGLDNSFHKESSAKDNTVVVNKREGVGNFVRATADFKEGTVKGSIYNVWMNVDEPYVKGEGSAVENNLVILDGKITPDHNSVIGDATLAYGEKDTGSFKGAFYGKGATELGGQFNSITEGYGEAKWGGVFGAQKVTSSKIDISHSSEQQKP